MLKNYSSLTNKKRFFHRIHSLHQGLQVMFQIVHHYVNLIHIAPDNNFLEKIQEILDTYLLLFSIFFAYSHCNDVGMLSFEQSNNFAQRSDRKIVFLLLHFKSL